MVVIIRFFCFLLLFEKLMKFCIKYMYIKILLVDMLVVSYKKNDGLLILYIVCRS